MKSTLLKAISFALIFLCFLSKTNAQQAAAIKPLRILTYNVQFLPGFAIHLKHKPHKRAAFIAEAIINDSIDVVVLQEMFDARGRKILEKEMKSHYPYMVGPGKSQPEKWKNGSGVMIFSKYPIKPLDKIKFSKCSGLDCVAKKGVIGVEVDYPNQKFQVFGTHFQAFSVGEIMNIQIKNLADLLKKHEQKNVPQFSAGDYNILKTDSNLYPLLLKETGAEDGEFSSEIKYTFDFVHNDMNYYKDEIEFLYDYILLKKNGTTPKSITREVRIYQHQWSKKNKDLSDHYAVLMNIEF
jgi:endonuclease/exonuclease/phosphatase family metal-dependent hydrolase